MPILSSIAYYEILGLPIIIYTGMITLLLLLFTASISMFNAKGINYISFKWHPRIAKITIVFALIHALFGLSVRLGL